ncbi:hypothetical protein HPULCUR_006028 [Helicostylum pulchrum]|uniref:WW domain-containing protein n=1 Tax=Helicostylum pulchrum TaxID=562976 RepID=A0ABP9Y0Q8_9FUNG
MPASKYNRSQRNSSSVESNPDPAKTVIEVLPVEPSPCVIVKTEPQEMVNISNKNHTQSNNYRPSRYATNVYYHQRSYKESLSPIYYNRTRSPLPYQRQGSFSPPPSRISRSERSLSVYAYQRARSNSPGPYQRDCSRSPRPYQREPRYRRDYSRSPSQYCRDYSRSRSPYRWDYSRSPSPYQWSYSRSPPPRGYTRSPPRMSRVYDRSPSYGYDRSRSPYYRRRSLSPYYRRAYDSVTPPQQRGRSPTVRYRSRDDSPVYRYQQYIPSYRNNRAPYVEANSRNHSPDYCRAEPAYPVWPSARSQSPTYIPSSGSCSRYSSPIRGQNVPSCWSTRRLSQQPVPYHRSPEYYRRSLSPTRVTTRTDRSLSRSTLQSQSTEELYHTPENSIIDLITPSRSPSVQSPDSPFEDGTIYFDEEKNSADISSESGEDVRVLPGNSMYMTRDNVNRRVNHVAPLPDTTDSTSSTYPTNAINTRQRPRLPAYWKVKMTNDGEIYYLNTITNEQSLTRPEV